MASEPRNATRTIVLPAQQAAQRIRKRVDLALGSIGALQWLGEPRPFEVAQLGRSLLAMEFVIDGISRSALEVAMLCVPDVVWVDVEGTGPTRVTVAFDPIG